MRTFVAAAAVLVYASADETSLMQARMQHSGKSSLSTDGQSSRQASTSKLLETAVTMIKNGVTPDVIEFVDSTNAEINDSVLVAIQSEHDIDQAYINSLCQAFEDAVQTLEDHAAVIENHDNSRLAATHAHHDCRADEAFKCAKSRRCEEQLREKWRIVKREEVIMREIHWSIHDEWCVSPPYLAAIPAWLTNDFNWADTSPYPILQIPADVTGLRHSSVTYFHSYMEQKIIVEHAWEVYRLKLIECSEFETEWEDAIEPCDQAQITARQHACEHAIANREARVAFGQEWDRIVRLYNDALIAKAANEQDRKNEWETLKIVQCLLDHVHSEVVTSIQIGGPCPTIDSDPEGVTLAIEDCHIVTRGCGPDSLTAHLCLDWCEIPEPPSLPPVEEPACTAEYVARQQAQFLADIQASYTTRLTAPDTVYPDDHLVEYQTILSPAGWAGCAPPLLCVDCEGFSTLLPVPTYDTQSHVCHLHEEYLMPGQSNSDSFRCLDGSCVSMSGRCNGLSNCADGSDEVGCDADDHWFVPAYVSTSYACPADRHPDVHFECGSTSLRYAALNPRCIDKVGMCNGIDNCGDNSDEAYCSGSIQVTVEATSGRTITVETLQMHSGVFHDREYNFNSLGHFTGKTFIKYSNDDKHTDHEHVMTKIRTLEPLTVYIVKLEDHSLPWLQAEGFERSSYSGVSFSGIRETRHKEWDESLLTTDHFSASVVWSKNFEAGTISIPGNNGGDGSFLIFLDRPGACDAMTHMMIQGCNNNPQDIEPGCNVADVRCCDTDGEACNSGDLLQTYTFLDGMVSEGSACAAGECNGVANTWCHGAVTFSQAKDICAANGQRLCTRAEIEDDTCCNTGCSHDSHLIWFGDNSPAPAPGGGPPVDPGLDDGQVRLVGLDDGHLGRGRLEIYHDGVWGTICDDHFTREDAAVACHQLGFSRFDPIIYRGETVLNDQDQIWLDNLGCTDAYWRLDQCNHNGWGVHNCRHHEDVHLECQELPDCGPLPLLLDAAWVHHESGVVQYHCDDGFSFDSTHYCEEFLTVQCLMSGLYSTMHSCLPIDDCPGHPCGARGTCIDLHMDYDCNCEPGFEVHLEHDEKICGNVDDCEGTMCGEAGVCVDLVQDYECRCNDGWEQVTADSFKTCERKECGTAPEIDNVAPADQVMGIFPWTRSKAVYGESVEYVCAPGYTTNGEVGGPPSFSIICQADQTYTQAQQCRPVSCGAPGPAGGATASSDAPVVFGESVEYNCPHGYGPDHFTRMCLEHGEFSPAIACEPKMCPAPIMFPTAHQMTDNGMFFFGQTVDYRCADGYTIDPSNPLSRDFSVTCEDDGWGVGIGGCVPVECVVDPDDTHSVNTPFDIECAGFSILSCAEGYTLDGTAYGATEQFPICHPNGIAEYESCRLVACPVDELMIALYSSVVESRPYFLGESATYSCNDGYNVALTGEEIFEVECLRTGKFSSMSTCRNIDDCVGHHCGSNGRCVDGINEYSCDCESGFEESLSEAGERMCGNIDDCGENACGGHGACHDLVNGYSCECDAGYVLDADGAICMPQVCAIVNGMFGPHAITSVDAIYYSDTLYVDCENGYEVVSPTKSQGFFQIECMADGSLVSEGRATLPQCTPVSCGTPPVCAAEQFEDRDFIYGEISVSACRGGDVVITHECGPDGQFRVTSQFSTCQNSCGHPALPQHAHRTDGGNAVVHPDSASFNCADGYTTEFGTSFSQECSAGGNFAVLTVQCVPVVCPRPTAPSTWSWVPSGSFDTRTPNYLTCADGYQSNACGPGGTVEITCDSSGSHSTLPSMGCYPINYPLSGRIRNAMPPQSPISGGVVTINGHSVTTSHDGVFDFQLPAGTLEYEIQAAGFITITGQVTVGALNTQFLEINMSPNLQFDEWRIVLTWSDLPQDLDSHIQWVGGSYWHSCSQMFYGARQMSCSGMTASLDVDDTNGNGPETTTLTGMTSYSGSQKVVYKVKNYRAGRNIYQEGWDRSGAEVALYRGDSGLVGRFAVGDGHGHAPSDGRGPCSGDGCYWSLFSIDSDGTFELCNNPECT